MDRTVFLRSERDTIRLEDPAILTVINVKYDLSRVTSTMVSPLERQRDILQVDVRRCFLRRVGAFRYAMLLGAHRVDVTPILENS